MTGPASSASWSAPATIFAWVFGVSFVVWLVIKAIMGIRVSEEEEYEGTDIGECGLEAYPEFTGTRGSAS